MECSYFKAGLCRSCRLIEQPYAQQLASLGWKQACRQNRALALGVNTAEGACVYGAVGEALGLPVTPIETLLA